MNRILVINSSINGENGNSTMLVSEFVEKLNKAQTNLNFTNRDLTQPETPHLTSKEQGFASARKAIDSLVHDF